MWKVLIKSPAGKLESNIMASAGVAAGVVAGDQLYAQPATPTKFTLSLQNPATWANIWVVVALLYLLGIYMGHIRVGSVG